ncbi:lipopolysaccharide transport periplasmic protein LptA [Rehaibacterium terrae]|jgi:lipopolysaccharide export system protein LptA|uniref:Lipopolysaccharide export system protein LptA n=1 Tax=Rehaibacterium terrae TaxID=1341696 RepID=A0A7W7V7C0_9GAMM|nr:lipopolysaccharide transport periplasmic protein LptA [Rehaibacterium terrae]MBB5014594.1 lipopolysaccharide export system protein LptA [Rehaibacterium terrae]
MFRSAADTALRSILLLAALALAPDAAARSDDRRQPMQIEADRGDALLTDDGESRLTGNVRITQGSLDVHADSALVIRRRGEIARVIIEGAPATLSQIDDEGNPMRAVAQRVEYDLSSDVIVLSGAVTVEQSRGTLSGEHVTYDLSTGRVDAGSEGGRVRMTIQPRGGEGAP